MAASPSDKPSPPHVVILGGGFGGLYAARALRRAKVRITLIDKRNHHLFQPLLYQVATAGLSAPDIAAPIRKILHRQKNVTVLLAQADSIDTEKRRVILTDGEIDYDYLLMAVGAKNNYFGHDEWEPLAPGLKSLGDALEIRRRVLLAYEAAERESDEARRREWLTFVVIGGGPTGVELAGALAEIANRTMTRNFRNFDPSDARVVLVEGGERILSSFDPSLSVKGERQLRRLGVEVNVQTMVEAIDEEGVGVLRRPEGGEPQADRIAARTVVWGAGVKGHPLGASLGVETDRGGRVIVEPTLSIPGRSEVQVIGDAAAFEQDGRMLPGVAQVAMQQGRHAARNIQRALAGDPALPFRYKDKGSMATIGRSKAVVETGRVKLSGFLAWVMWLFVHILFLIGFRNRFVVFFEWAYAYFTYQRSARVILDRPLEIHNRWGEK